MRTVSQLDRLLGEYTAPDKSFVSRLNQVLVKLYPMGPWRELRTEWSVDVSSGYICLPPDYECLLAGNLQDGPIVIQDMMLEYESMGLGAVYRPVSHGIGMIDRGYVPVMSNLPAEGLETLTFTLTLGAFVTGAAITVNYITFDGAETQTLSPTSGTAVTLTPVSSNILAITGISYSNLTARVLAQADDSDANTITYAILLPGENSCQFRRYDIPQVPASPTDQWLLRGVVKRAFCRWWRILIGSTWTTSRRSSTDCWRCWRRIRRIGTALRSTGMQPRRP
jgi:hypothetical protein